MYAADLVETGFVEMSVFQALFAGRVGQPPTLALDAGGGGGLLPHVEARVRSAAATAKWDSRVYTLGVSANRRSLWSGPMLVSFPPR